MALMVYKIPMKYLFALSFLLLSACNTAVGVVEDTVGLVL
jgi:predicted small secreted protein